ncbi:hypothetical protein C8J57DRAFT_1242233 [Mycena rebaudengoi]|nr:hypothetical protein C8J57DRAFT_1242233 [Mycena rebaudengoi]
MTPAQLQGGKEGADVPPEKRVASSGPRKRTKCTSARAGCVYKFVGSTRRRGEREERAERDGVQGTGERTEDVCARTRRSEPYGSAAKSAVRAAGRGGRAGSHTSPSEVPASSGGPKKRTKSFGVPRCADALAGYARYAAAGAMSAVRTRGACGVARARRCPGLRRAGGLARTGGYEWSKRNWRRATAHAVPQAGWTCRAIGIMGRSGRDLALFG